MRSHITPGRITVIEKKKIYIVNVGELVEKMQSLYIVIKTVIVQPLGKTV